VKHKFRAWRTAFRVQFLDESMSGGLRPSKGMHKMPRTLSGAVGGAFGGFRLWRKNCPSRQPSSCRSMADIARGQGENIRDIETQLACWKFSRSRPSKTDRGGFPKGPRYYGTRAALATRFKRCKYITRKRVGQKRERRPSFALLRGSPSVQRTRLRQIRRPVDTADWSCSWCRSKSRIHYHFQDMARGHFTMRRLERKYGEK